MHSYARLLRNVSDLSRIYSLLLFQGMIQSEKGFKRIRIKESDHGRLINDNSTWI